MASITSTTSSTSSLGNTSLRGYGGMVSGIDRDAVIEQMTLGTTTKINNQKKAMTELEWKQEAYRSVSDKILDLSDTYASYSSSSNLKDAMVFAKNQITVNGIDTSTKFVTASGTSQMVDNLSLLGVGQMATSTVRRSDSYGSTVLSTSLKGLDDVTYSSKLSGAILSFGTYVSTGDDPGWKDTVNFTFPSSFSYTDDNKEEQKVTIDYVNESAEEIAEKLNLYLKHVDETTVGGTTLSKAGVQFGTKEDGNGNTQLTISSGTLPEGYVIRGGTALAAFGISADNIDSEKGLTIQEFNNAAEGDFKVTSRWETTALDNMTGQKFTFTYNGSAKSIELITADEAQQLKNLTVEEALKHLSDDDKMVLQGLIDDGTITNGTKINDPNLDSNVKGLLQKAQNNMMAENLTTRLERAYGTGTVSAEFGDDGLQFNVKEGATLSITSSDSELLKNLGLEYGSSNKVNLDGKLSQAAISSHIGDINDPANNYLKDNGELDLVINGVAVTGLTANSSISDILSKINSSDAGVKATYVDATGEFMLVSSETGEGRQVSLDSELAKNLFYGTDSDGNEKLVEGKNAEIYVSYGDGNAIKLERSSNTFNLEGLTVSVTGVFGGIQDDGTTISWDSSQSITFTAKADVDGVTEKVKNFFESFNALVTEINDQVRTRPDSSYGALTDEQKAEMDETSIENWEKKAKQGILYGDSIMRDMSSDVEAIFVKLMQNGASYEDLKEIGITYSEDYTDGGTLVFDETAFRQAMESNPDKVANIFTGGGGVSKGLIDVVDETFTPYATRYAAKNGNSYGRLIEMAGSTKKPTTLLDNEIYRQLKDMEETIATLQERLQTEQDRYISQFTTMETLINQMNTQQSYLSQIMA